MAYFSARDQTPAQVCREAVANSDIFVVIAGFRYGSLVSDQPEFSHTEFEHHVADELGIPRLVFLLSYDADGPARMFVDSEFGARQQTFRERLTKSRVTVATVNSPDGLETALLHALTKLTIAAADQTSLVTGRRRLWTIPARTAAFTGREDVLAHLAKILGVHGRAMVAAVTGMGGLGKTTIAVEYAHRHADDFDIAWWIPAEDPTLVGSRLATLAHTLHFADPADPDDIAVARLLGELVYRSRWLLVFDNAEHPPALADYLPTGLGQVLITSRNPDWTHLAILGR